MGLSSGLGGWGEPECMTPTPVHVNWFCIYHFCVLGFGIWFHSKVFRKLEI